MKRFLPCFACIYLVCTSLFGQSLAERSDASRVVNDRPAQVLFEDANGYLGRRYREFNKQKLPYDAKLESKTKQEQRELAAKNAAILQSRKTLQGDDLYFLGLLNHLAGDGDAALNTMKRFLKDDPDGEKPQLARNVVVLYSIKKDLVADAEATVAAYARHQPQNPEDRYKMELLIADAYLRAKQYGSMAAHAERMMEAARLFATVRKDEVFKRDEQLLKSAALLADAYDKSGRKKDAVNTFAELTSMAISLPSGNLYRLAKARLLNLDPKADLIKLFKDVNKSDTAPEIVATQWIDQAPRKLNDLKGQVVLLDFWAHWCGPCQYTLPQLEKWHETYKDKGLVILGLTNYYGDLRGQKITPGEELAYLREFKKRNRLEYGVAVADTHVNDFNYGVFSIPTSFLIDRKGVVRYIAAGADDDEMAELGRMIKKVLAEPIENLQSGEETVKQR